MDKHETKYWVTLKKYLPGAHQRVESHETGSGIPDVFICYKSVSLWFELKVEGTFQIKPSQLAWHTRHASHGGLSFIVVKSGRQSLVYSGRRVKELKEVGLEAKPNLVIRTADRDGWVRMFNDLNPY